MNQSQEGPWTKQADSVLRAFSGAFLFGVPVVYTMELWWLGKYIQMWKLLLLLGLALGANLVLTYFAGYQRQSAFSTTVDQAVGAMAVGIVAGGVSLWALNLIHPGMPIDTVLGRLVVQAALLGLGASVANALIPAGQSRQKSASQQRTSPWRNSLNDLGATIAGAIFISFSIAPTREIPTIAAGIDYWHQLSVIALSLLVSYAIVFQSGFQTKDREKGLFARPIEETIVAYAVSLMVALGSLYLFDQTALGSLHSVVAQTLILGFPAAVGGAGGRLVI